MSGSKKCLKCGHTAAFVDAAPLACPNCGAVYSKVEASINSGGQQTPRPRPSNIAPSRAEPAFIETLRNESLYPTFRGLVRVATWLYYIGALIVIAVAIFGGFSDGSGRIITIVATVISVVVITAAKEAALMLADLSDAAVHMAGSTKD